MTENVHHYVITWDAENVQISFTDLFGDGEVYTFPTFDALRIRDALSYAIEQQALDRSPVPPV